MRINTALIILVKYITFVLVLSILFVCAQESDAKRCGHVVGVPRVGQHAGLRMLRSGRRIPHATTAVPGVSRRFRSHHSRTQDLGPRVRAPRPAYAYRQQHRRHADVPVGGLQPGIGHRQQRQPARHTCRTQNSQAVQTRPQTPRRKGTDF